MIRALLLVLVIFLLIVAVDRQQFEYVSEDLGDAVTPKAQKLSDTIKDLPKEARIDAKATELAKIDALPKETVTFSGETKQIQIFDVQKIEDGVQVFVQAWNEDGSTLGFGKDGTIETERIVIKNPPILVPDPAGDIVRTSTDPDGNVRETRFREDPELALKQVVTHVVSKVGSEGTTIEKGTVGNTTYTDYPTMDGYVARQTSSDTTWTLARDTADGTGASTADAAVYTFAEQRTVPTRFEVSRAFYIFDTSDIPDTDNIDSGTFTAYSEGDDINIAAYGLIQTSPASDSSLAVGDYDAMTINSPDEGAARVTPSGTSGTANTWTLNATGLSWINKTGNTRLGLRHARDIDNSAPSARTYWATYMVDVVGTSLDPVLVVETSPGAPAETTVYPVTTMSQNVIMGGSVIIKP